MKRKRRISLKPLDRSLVPTKKWKTVKISMSWEAMMIMKRNLMRWKDKKTMKKLDKGKKNNWTKKTMKINSKMKKETSRMKMASNNNWRYNKTSRVLKWTAI